jgi:hypothetical protein
MFAYIVIAALLTVGGAVLGNPLIMAGALVVLMAAFVHQNEKWRNHR